MRWRFWVTRNCESLQVTHVKRYVSADKCDDLSARHIDFSAAKIPERVALIADWSISLSAENSGPKSVRASMRAPALSLALYACWEDDRNRLPLLQPSAADVPPRQLRACLRLPRYASRSSPDISILAPQCSKPRKYLIKIICNWLGKKIHLPAVTYVTRQTLFKYIAQDLCARLPLLIFFCL